MPKPDAVNGIATDETATQTAAEAEDGDVSGEEPKRKVPLTVEITDTGPCKRHVSIEIARDEVDRQFEESLKEVRKDAALPGFRPGRAPAGLVRKRYGKELTGQVKSTLLMAAMTQLDEDYKLNAISQPDLNLDAVELPEDGPMRFQFDLEVEPEFELPEIAGIQLKRPVKAVSEADIDEQLRSFMERYAQIVPKEEGAAELGDFVTADLTFHKDGVIFNEARELQFRLQPVLRFQDGHVPEIGAALVGAKPGETRTAKAIVGTASKDAALRGQEITITFNVKDLKRHRMPELNEEFLDKIGFDSVDELRTALRGVLERRVEFNQRRELRKQVLDHLIGLVPFDLPADLVARQEESTLKRQIEEMKQAGLSENDLRARRAELRANAHEQTLRSLKEHFLLAKIADAKNIEVNDDDLEAEIESIAERADESARRVRARVRNEGLVEALSQQILERKALDHVLSLAVIEDVAMDQDRAVETVDELASPMGDEPAAESNEDETGDES